MGAHGLAYIIPSDITRLALSGAHSPELHTLGALKNQLSPDYTVFHGVHWTREYEGWTVYGEIDFVVLNRSGAVLFIEQKNGPLEGTDGGLVKRYEEGTKNIAEQLHRSLNRVRQKFQWQHGRARALEADYLVYCPDYRVRNVNAVGLDVTRIVDARDRDSLAQRIQSILGPGSRTQEGWYQKVYDFFCQSFQVVPDIHARVSAHERAFVRQAGGVASILANLEMTPYRLRFTGSAGSGKSLLARQFYAREAAEGKRVLLSCFNRPLATRLKERLPAQGRVDTFHGFCVEFLRSRGQPPDFEGSGGDPEFWRRIPELVIAQHIPDDWIFDALVVDEGQDFEQGWLEVLTLFLRRGSDILWLEDPDQNLRGRPPVGTEDFVGYRCPVNYRSPESIARVIRNTLPFEFDLGNDLPGMGVGVHGYTDPDEQPKVVTRVVQDLLRRGFAYEDIAVLTCRGAGGSVFSVLDAVGGVSLRRFTEKYDAGGNQIFTEGQLVFDSVRRFKGQESPAIILVDVDPRPDRLAEEERVLYCGMTRATVRLDMLARADNPENRRFF